MRSTIVFLVAAGLWAAPAPAAGAPATAPTTAPARPRVARPPDLLAGAIDPYLGGAERERFFQAAGVDNELSRDEVAASRRHGRSFVRRFDRWKAMAAFDKNRNGTLDWFEADAYRQDQRKRLLKMFDTNKDGRLTGRERDKANALLATGRTPGPATRPAIAATSRPGADERDWMRQRMLRQRTMLLSKHDKNGDGRLDEAERQAMLDAVRKGAAEQMAVHRLRTWDADGDGTLSEAETAAMEADLAEARQRNEKRRGEQDLRRWDANDDGKLDEAETAAMDAEQARRREQGEKWRAEWEMRQYDLNRDGTLDADEQMLADAARTRREAYERDDLPGRRQRNRQQWQAKVAQWRLKHFDEDGDGQLSEAENADVKQFEKRLRDVGMGLRNRMSDRDGDGQVSAEERAATRQEWRKAGWKIFAKSFRYMDGDGDGQISPQERSGFRGRMQTGMVRWFEKLTGDFDADRNGRLEAPERNALIEGVQKDLGRRVEKFDTDRDGRLSVDETIRMMEAFVQKDLGIKPAPPREDEAPNGREGDQR